MVGILLQLDIPLQEVILPPDTPLLLGLDTPLILGIPLPLVDILQLKVILLLVDIHLQGGVIHHPQVSP